MRMFLKQWKIIYKDTYQLKKDNYLYGLELAFTSCLVWGTILLLAILVGKFYETLIFYGGFLIIRKLIGGYHASSIIKCYMLSIITYGIFVVILFVVPKELYQIINIVLASFVIIGIKTCAPRNRCENATLELNKEKNRKVALIISAVQLLLVEIEFFIYPYSIIAFTLCLGSFTAVLALIMDTQHVGSVAKKKYRSMGESVVKHGKILHVISAVYLVLSMHSICNGPYFEPDVPTDFYRLKDKVALEMNKNR